MENRIDILNELNALSPLIAGMEKVNVFTIPAGYFERLGDDILILAKKEDTNLLEGISPSLQVPQGYFESLAYNILNRIKAQENATEELKDLSPLLHGIQNKNVFTVPQGYFESLSDAVLNKMNSEETAAEELKELSPLLYSIQNKNIFTVPQGYFETLPGKILGEIIPQQAKVITIHKRTAAFFKYAVAAVFTGAMALGVYKFTNGGGEKIIMPSYVAEAGKIKNVDEELAKISDDDIIKYLQANGENIDAQTVAANLVNDNDLPAREDYMNDDKALDKYLDNIDVSDLKN